MSFFPEAGYLYAAFGHRRYFEEAITSVASLRLQDPSAHVTLVTDRLSLNSFPNLASNFDHVAVCDGEVEENDEWKNRLTFKPRCIYDGSPYERTFFVDTDTYFVGNCRCLFSLLDHYDLCLAHGANDRTPITVRGQLLTGYTPYNTGVVLIRKNKISRQVLEHWYHAYKSGIEKYPHDQPALMEALATVPCRLYVLHNLWNARFKYFEKYRGRVMILHGRHNDYERLARRINASHKQRVWLPPAEMCLYQGISKSEVGRSLFTLAKWRLGKRERQRKRNQRFRQVGG